MAMALLSIVVPCFNEEEVIFETHRQLVETLTSRSGLEIELIYIDDGSTDNTYHLLEKIQSDDRRVRVISFSRNFGHQIAITAGLAHSAGDAVVIIDADLQDPPEVILRMLDSWEKGAQVVYGVRQERNGETVGKLWTAKTFYRLINYVSDITIPTDTGDFRLMDRSVVEALLSMPERDRFMRGMAAWVGFRQEPLFYSRAPRFAGTTKYPLSKMVRFAADGIVSFSLAPLRIAMCLGFITAVLSAIGILYALTMRFFTHIWVPGWTLLFVTLLFVGGMQMVFLGVLGEYLGRVYGEVKRRPLYLVKARLGFPGMGGFQSANPGEQYMNPSMTELPHSL
jgi:polyisoprenyl-phosphate glycosyltransferase